MGIYLKKFSAHTDYEAAKSSLMPPNVSFCVSGPRGVHYKDYCRPSTVYELVGNPSYPSTINGDVASFNITINYRLFDTDQYCQETVTEGTDTVTIECGQNPSTSDARTVSGSIDYHGIEIEYSVTQNKFSNNSAITYYAQSKLLETTDSKADGLHTYSFNPTIKSHTFSNGIGTITFNGDLTSIGSYAFQGCTGLTSIVIPYSVASIGSEAFYYCTGLTSIDIPNSVKSISSYAFYYCKGITSCTIGSGVTSISNYAFYNCSGLTSITCNATTAPTIQSNTFQNIGNDGTLHVPIGSTGYNTWMGTGDYYLGKYNWTKVEQ